MLPIFIDQMLSSKIYSRDNQQNTWCVRISIVFCICWFLKTQIIPTAVHPSIPPVNVCVCVFILKMKQFITYIRVWHFDIMLCVLVVFFLSSSSLLLFYKGFTRQAIATVAAGCYQRAGRVRLLMLAMMMLLLSTHRWQLIRLFVNLSGDIYINLFKMLSVVYFNEWDGGGFQHELLLFATTCVSQLPTTTTTAASQSPVCFPPFFWLVEHFKLFDALLKRLTFSYFLASPVRPR